MMQEIEEIFNNCTNVKNSGFTLLLSLVTHKYLSRQRAYIIRIVIPLGLLTQCIIKCANQYLFLG